MKPLVLEAESVSGIFCDSLRTRSFDVHLSAEISAAQRCLFYALTLPEYLEAWLHMPDDSTVHASVSNSPDELRFDRYSSRRHVGTIVARLHAMSQDSISFAWRNDRDRNAPSTAVHVTLRGKKGACTLDLTHSGFRTEEERRWHDAMWTCSLRDLNHLMRR